MRRPSYLLAALLACATPAVAQQAADATVGPSTPAPSQPASSQAAPEQPAPSLFVSDAEIREQLREHDRKQGVGETAEARRAVPMQYVWLAGAIAVGIIVAAIVL